LTHFASALRSIAASPILVTHAKFRIWSLKRVYRLWRDSGYAVGALLASVLTDRFGVPWALVGIGLLTLVSGCLAFVRMHETLPARRGSGGEEDDEHDTLSRDKSERAAL